MLVATLSLAACSDKKEALGPSATLPQPTTTIDPYAIPPVIDEAYVNRVLAGLDQAVGDVTRLVVREKAIPPMASQLLSAIYVDEEQLELEIQLFQSALSAGLVNVHIPPGNRITTVAELLTVRSDCIFAKVEVDRSAVTIAPNPAFRTRWIAIVPIHESNPTDLNRTGWGFIYDGFQRDLSAPSDPCAER